MPAWIVRRGAGPVAALLLLVCRGAAADPVEASCWEARFLDVGQGDAAIVRTGSGESMVVDVGPRGAGERVLAAVRALGRAPDLLVLTHAHADHIGGFRPLVDAFRASRILDAGLPFGSQVYRALLRTAAAQRRSLEVARRGRSFRMGPRVAVEVLAPEEPLVAHSRSDANANSVVLAVACGRISMLLMGDAERDTERRLLAHRTSLAADVLKVAHHGSRYASSSEFVEAVHPRIAVISCGARNRYRHPAPATVDRLRRIGAAVHRTDTEGDVVVRSDGDRVQASSSRPSEGP